MGNTNCFCHLNDFAVKDAQARADIEKANRKIDENSANLRQQMSDLADDVHEALNGVTEDIEGVTKDIGEVSTQVDGLIGIVAESQEAMEAMEQDINTMKEDIEALENQSGGGSVDSDELDEIKEDVRGIKSDNLVDVIGAGYVSATGEISGMTENGECVTDFIKLRPASEYLIEIITETPDNNYWCGIGVYDAEKHFVQRRVITERKYLFYADSDYDYIRVSARFLHGEGRFIVREATTPHHYVESYEQITKPNDEYNVRSIAHRGYSFGAPENTASAFKLAKRKGFKYVECDVCFTSDNIPVVHHDSTIDRTSNGTGNIADKTLAELKALDFGSWFSAKYAGEKILTFDEFMKLCRNLGLHPYVELKQHGGSMYESEAMQLLEIVDKYGMAGKMTWISFDYTSLESMIRCDRNSRYGYIVSDITDESARSTASFNMSELRVALDNMWLEDGKKSDRDQLFIDLYYTQAGDDYTLKDWFGQYPVEVWTLDELSHYDHYNVVDRVQGITTNGVHWGEIFKKRSIL